MIGDLKYRVTLKEEVRVADGGGGFTAVWQALAENPEVYAAITPISGTEVLRDHQLAAAATHRIIIRYRNDVTPAQRIEKDGAVYDIIAVKGRALAGAFLEILAAERVS